MWAFCFTALTLLATMKISLHSQVLRWFGEHVFSIYVIQRLPMLVLDTIPFFDKHRYAFLFLSFAIALPMALLLERLLGAIDGRIWRSRPAEAPAAAP